MTVPQWRNRIVGHAEIDPAQLLANPRNWRIHPKAQRDALKGAITEIGFTDSVEVQLGTDMVLDGHLRVALALQEEQPTIWITYLDLNDAEANAYLLTKDPLSAMANADSEHLDTLMRETSVSDAALMQMISDMAEREGMIPGERFDPNAEWVGMPEFDQEDKLAAKSIIVNFETEAAVDVFARLVEQDVSMTTRSIWFPKVERRRAIEMGWVSGESDA